jgi:hypothetical protein
VKIRKLLKKLRRERDQLTVELAEEGVAPAPEVEATEERIAEHRDAMQEAPKESPG